MTDLLPRRLEAFVDACIRRRRLVVAVYAIATLIMFGFALRVQVKTLFDDLLPRNHPYIQVHEQIKRTFGGSNLVSIMLEAEHGEIFQVPVLRKVQNVTRQLQKVDGVNQFQIISLASKKLKEIRGSTDAIELHPVMWPDIPHTDSEMRQLKDAVERNPLVYGSYVSIDLKAALITVDFYDDEVDYKKIFPEIMAIADAAKGDGVRVRVVGEPILYGWVGHYLPETVGIFLATIACLVVLLFAVARTWRGTLLPLLAGVTSAIWALGTASLLGFNLDPLVIVIAFLITARAISHSVQLVTRFDDELAGGTAGPTTAAKAAMLQLFKPGMLGVVADAGCMTVVVLTPIPLLQKVSIIGTVWVSTIALTACVLTPILLSWVARPRGFAHRLDVTPALHRILDVAVRVATSRYRYDVLAGVVVAFVMSAAYAFNLKVGDADPGSPILWQDAQYNQDATAINGLFQGADRMLVAFEGDKPGAIKAPATLESMGAMQRFMAAQPEVGGSLSIADLIPAVRRVLHEGNPRYQELGDSAQENGELMYMFVTGSDPGDMARFTDPQARNAAVAFNFRDHKGETIRTAVARVKEFVDKHPTPEGRYRLAGGLIGVLAAVNEVILSGQIESIALALLVLVVCCAVAYRSAIAGVFFMVPVVLANTLTFSYMAWKGIGMNISTLPVAALGIGLGVDYAFYIVDAIREDLLRHGSLERAIATSIRSAGKGVLVTALTLTVSVVMWCSSSLRFQADMGLLMAIWLGISALSALFLMPAMVYIFQPDFIVRGRHRERPPAAAAPSSALPAESLAAEA